MRDEMGTRFCRFLTLWAAVVAFASAGLAYSQDDREPQGKRYALIIAKSNYGGGGRDDQNQNDGKYLREALQDAGWNVKLLSFPESNASSEKDAWLKDIKEWRDKTGFHKNDVALFYFSGHGEKGADGKLYFPTKQFFARRADKNALARYALPFEDIRAEFQKVTCANRIVVLDVCHAGASVSNKASVNGKINSDDLVKLFLSSNNALPKSGGEPPITIFASSSADQVSGHYASLQTSIYTYWFCDAFSSHNADANEDRKISLNELSKYLEDKVGKQDMSNPQKPMAINADRNDLAFPYAALSYDKVADKCAERLAFEINKRGVAGKSLRVLVTTAIVDEETGKRDVERWGKASTEIADTVRGLLKNKTDAYRSFEVIEKREVEKILDDPNGLVAPGELGGKKGEELLRRKKKADGEDPDSNDYLIDAIVYGDFSETNSISEDRFHYVVRFRPARGTPDKVESAEYIIRDESWRSIEGETHLVPETNASPSGRGSFVETPVGVATLETAETVAALDEQEEWGENYFRLDPEEREFDVEIRVCPPGVKDPKPSDYRELRQGKVLKDAKYWLPLEIGEKYKIALKNKTDKTLYARVFVDGVSSLDWTNKTIGTMKGAGSGEEKFKIARQDDGQTFERENGENDGQDGGQTPARENGAIDAHNDEQTVNREGDKGAEEGVVRIADQDFVVPWVVAPDSRSKQPIELLGFYSRPSDSSAGNQSLGLRYFKVVPANQSIAGDENDKNIGLITVQFLRKTNKPSKTKGGSVGTGADPSGETMEVTTKTLPPVELAATLQIYYCSKKEFEEKAK